MTLLAPLKPERHPVLGIESFPSYLRRLACVYSISLPKLIRYLCESEEICRIADQKPFRAVTQVPRTLASYGNITKSLVHRTEMATGNSNLGCMTLLHIGLSLSRNCVGSLSGVRRFCPDCASAIRGEGDSAIPEPLLWSLSSISYCPIHRLPLEAIHSDWRELPRVERATSAPSHWRWDSYEEWRIAESLKILAHGYDHPGELAQTDAIPHFLNACMEHRGLQFRDMMVLTRIDHGNLQMYLDGHKAMTLKTVVALAQQLAVSPVDIFFSPHLAATSTLLFDESAHARDATRHLSKNTHPHRSKAILSRLRHQLKALLSSATPLPSFKQLCLKEGVSTGYVRYRFPTESATYMRRRSREGLHAYICRRREALTCARQFVARHGVPRSLRKAEQTLRAETGLSKALLERALQRVAYESRKR